MKKILSLTSLALLGVVALTGCSCGKDGTYELLHVEYKDGDETKTTDCKKTANLPDEVKLVCEAFVGEDADITSIVIDGNKMYAKGYEDNAIFFKIEDEKVLVSETEDGKYEDSEIYKYKDGKLYFVVSEDIFVVYDN